MIQVEDSDYQNTSISGRVKSFLLHPDNEGETITVREVVVILDRPAGDLGDEASIGVMDLATNKWLCLEVLRPRKNYRETRMG